MTVGGERVRPEFVRFLFVVTMVLPSATTKCTTSIPWSSCSYALWCWLLIGSGDGTSRYGVWSLPTSSASSSSSSASNGDEPTDNLTAEGGGGGGTCDATTGACEKYGITASNITNCLVTEQNPQRPVYTSQTFVDLRNVYRRVHTNYIDNDLDDVMGKIRPENAADQAGLVVPFAISTIPGTSYRGVFATANIRRGQPVWSPLFLGSFDTEHAWLAYLHGLLQTYGAGDYDLGKHLACDVLQWSYVMGDPRNGYEVVIDLDEGSFVNHGWTQKGQANIADDVDVDVEDEDYVHCPSCMRASRDIAAGEQIMTDYTIFYKFGALEWYDASVAKAWDVDRSSRRTPTTTTSSSGEPEEPQWHYR